MSNTEQRAKEVAEASGADEDAILGAMQRLMGALDMSPKAELKWRLNQQVQMIDPGEPVNWRGLSR